MRSSLLAASLALPSALAYANPGGCSGDCFTHDPALFKRDDGTYFRYTSTGGIPIKTSKSLAGPWTNVGDVIKVPSVIDMPGKNDLWAPDIFLVGKTYYCFYAVSTGGSHISAIGYATSDSMEPGSWKDQHALVHSTNTTDYNAIDPNFIAESPTGPFHLQWGSYWENIWTAPITLGDGPADVSVSEDAKQIAYTPEGIHKMEGSYMFRNGDYYYEFLSVGACCTYDPKPPAGEEYHIVVCRSKSPTGPFVDKDGKSCTDGGGTTVLASHDNVYAPGGQGVLRDPAHGDVLYYHYLDPADVEYKDSKFGWNVISWVDGWPTV